MSRVCNPSVAQMDDQTDTIPTPYPKCNNFSFVVVSKKGITQMKDLAGTCCSSLVMCIQDSIDFSFERGLFFW